MQQLWNDPYVLPPPIQTLPHNSRTDVSGLIHITQNIIKVLNKQSPLYQESALMARFLYKFDKKFRNDIGYRTFKKVNTALKKCFKLNFLKEIKDFENSLPLSQEDMYLPSRQMLEYLLVKLQTFSKLFLRVCICSKKSAIFYLNRIKRGESHWMSLMPYALLSRIWSLCLVLLRHSCNWYAQLNKYLPKLLSKGLPFLPENYLLPTDLEEWLDFNNFEDFGRIEWQERKKLDIKINLIEDDEINSFQEILAYVKEINNEEPVVQNNFPKINNIEEDIEIKTVVDKADECGEVVLRDSIKASNNNIDPSKRKIHSPAGVTNKQSLLEFVNKEDSFRCSDNTAALTSHLSFMQWQALKTSLMNLHGTLCKNRKIQKKFLKLWQDKCLDYCE